MRSELLLLGVVGAFVLRKLTQAQQRTEPRNEELTA